MMRRAVLICGIVAATSCVEIPEAHFSRFADIPEEGVPQGWEFVFNPTESDSAGVISGPHDIVVATRYTKECPSRSIILRIEEFSLAHTTPDTATVEIPLFDDEGNPLGRGIYGIYEISDTIRKGITVADGYSVALSSPLPAEETRGIKALGIVVAPSGTPQRISIRH